MKRILFGNWGSKNTQHVMMDLGLLLLRVGVGGLMVVQHGWPKLQAYADKLHTFSDPLGIGSPASLTLAVFAEFFCGIAVMLGLATRWVAIPLVITMGVAAFLVHADDPFKKKEFALVYMLPFLTLVFTGAGCYSLDKKLR